MTHRRRSSRARRLVSWSAPRWTAPLVGVAAVVLVPWVVLLFVALPSTHQSAHWDIAWGGLDVMLALVLVTVAVCAWRRSPWLEAAAAAATTLLFVDAWFDVLTSSTRTELVIALVEAVVVELPLAFLCLLLARDAEQAAAARASRTRNVDVEERGRQLGEDVTLR